MPRVITPSGNKFLAKLGLDDVEIGDILSPNFKPHVKIKRHANQCDLAISYPTTATGLATFNGQTNTVGFTIDSNTRIEIYSKDPDSELVDGSMEFDVILTKKPAGNKNTIALKLDSTTINWKKILPLNVEYDQAKCIEDFPKHQAPFVITPTSITDATGEVLKTRAENRVNSYEGEAKQNKHDTSVLGKNKFNKQDITYTRLSRTHAHIRRGKAKDAVGTEVWVEDMNLVGDTLTFTLPVDFIKNATYPIRQAVGVDPAYTQDMDSFQSTGYGGSDDVWGNYDIYTNKSVPKGAVAEMILSNATTGTENTLGVRTDGSALTRQVSLHEAEGDGQTHCRMFVTVHATTGLIEPYHSDVSDADYFYIERYWQNVTFTEKTVGLSDYGDWKNWDLSADPSFIPKGSVVHFLFQVSTESSASIGIRTDGSSLNRRIVCHEAESGGNSYLDMFAKTDPATGIVEAYGSSSHSPFYVGYFGSEMDFVELWQEITLTTTNWEAEDLTAYLDQDGRMVDFLLTHSNEGAELYLGVRGGDDGATERKLLEHEAESAGAGGEYTGFSMSAQTNASGVVNLISSNSGEKMMLTGYFKPAVTSNNYTFTGLAKLGTKALGTRVTANTRSGLVKNGIKALSTRKITATRSGLALNGLKAFGNGLHGYIYTGLAKLGLKAFAERRVASQRSGLAKEGEKATGTRVVTATRSGLAKLGEKPLGTRQTVATRSGLVLLGEKALGTRKFNPIRTGLAKLGLKAFAERQSAGIRIGLAKAGLQALASRLTTATRSGLAKEGLNPIGTRNITESRSGFTKLGLKPFGTRNINSQRSGLGKLGEKALGDRNITAIRSGLAHLGIKAFGNRIISATRSGFAKLGLKALATFEYTVGELGHYTFTALAKLGLKPFGTRGITSTRSGLVKIGIKGLADRKITASRSGIAKLGEKPFATRQIASNRSGLGKLGEKAFGTRKVTSQRPALAKLGLKALGTRKITATISGLAKLGLKAFGTGIKSGAIQHFTYTALAKLGLKTLGTRQVNASRIGLVKIGVKVYGTRQVNASRIGLVKLGLKGYGTRQINGIRSGLAKMGLKPIGNITLKRILKIFSRLVTLFNITSSRNTGLTISSALTTGLTISSATTTGLTISSRTATQYEISSLEVE